MTAAIPLIDLTRQQATVGRQVAMAIARVVASGQYVLGPEVEAFEREFSAYLGAGEAIGVDSGTSALQLALLAAGVGPGDEVITVSHTAVATVVAIELVGARPVLVDIEPGRFTLDPAALGAALTRRTRAIVPVHLYGTPADLAPILDFAERHRLTVIEDCAQAHGARYRARRVGTWGHLGAFSFYPTKNLGALGDGGAVVTSDPALGTRVRELRQYGWRQRYISETRGVNARLDEIQAAVLRAKLPYLDSWNARRRQLAAGYRERLAHTDLILPGATPDSEPVYHQFVVRTQSRETLRASLAAQAIGSAVHYPALIHQQPAYATLAQTHIALDRSEQIVAEILSLPIYPALTNDELQRICDTIEASLSA